MNFLRNLYVKYKLEKSFKKDISTVHKYSRCLIENSFKCESDIRRTLNALNSNSRESQDIAKEALNKIITRHKFIHTHLTKLETQLEIFNIATKSQKFVEKASRTNEKLLERNLLIMREFSNLLEDFSN